MKKEKVSFAKFFPESHSFVTLAGSAKGSNDFDVSLDISDGSDTVRFYLSDWHNAETVKMLENLKKAIEMTMAFQSKAMGMKPSERTHKFLEMIHGAVDEVKPAAKKPAAKKAASKKKAAK